jgi:hypothetical protein
MKVVIDFPDRRVTLSQDLLEHDAEFRERVVETMKRGNLVPFHGKSFEEPQRWDVASPSDILEDLSRFFDELRREPVEPLRVQDIVDVRARLVDPGPFMPWDSEERQRAKKRVLGMQYGMDFPICAGCGLGDCEDCSCDEEPAKPPACTDCMYFAYLRMDPFCRVKQAATSHIGTCPDFVPIPPKIADSED